MSDLAGISELGERFKPGLRRAWIVGVVLTLLGGAAIVTTLLMSEGPAVDEGPTGGEGAVGETSSGCKVTAPMPEQELASSPEASSAGVSVNYGNGDLWVFLPPSDVPPVARMGAFYVKVPWWRASPGQLQMKVKRLDGSGVGTGMIPDGYGAEGFQASGLVLSDLGCWEVTGRLGSSEVTFVIKVEDPADASF